LILIGLFFVGGCARKNADITINVITPSSTPPDARLFIVGNHELLGNWSPGSKALERKSDSLWSATFTFPRDFYLEFKITRGSWNSQAIYRRGEIPPNITLTVSNDTVIKLTPVDWQDIDFKSGGGIVGVVEYHRNFRGNDLNYPRDIIVWLPPSYRKDSTMRYPVLYMHDGQNIIDPSTSFIGYDWHVDEVSDSLIRTGRMKEIIVVGIYNTPDRRDEYGNTRLGHAYMNFIITMLKPFIDTTYRTLRDRENTATMGSSMGGMISFLIVWNYPNIFSQAGCISPAFFGGIIDSVREYTGSNKEIRIYIDNGGLGLEQELQPGCDEMFIALKKIGFVDGQNLLWYHEPSAEHNERAWAARLWRPLLYMFGR